MFFSSDELDGTIDMALSLLGKMVWTPSIYFTVESSVPLMRSGHAIELSTVFNHPEDTLVTGRQFDETFSKTMRKMWVQFAKTGNPDNEYIPHWEKYSADNRQTMELNSKGCVCHKDLNTENLNGLRYIYEN